MTAKETVHRTFETSLAEGVRFEDRLLHSTFATEDRKKGMQAFIEKINPVLKDRSIKELHTLADHIRSTSQYRHASSAKPISPTGDIYVLA